MKNRDEYIASIFAKRDKELIRQKKRISAISSIICLTLCFAAIFAFVPKKFGMKSSVSEPVNEIGNSITKTDLEINSETESTIINQNILIYTNNDAYILNEKNTQFETVKKESNDEIGLQTEIAIEAPDEAATRQINFGYAGEPFNPDLLSKPSAVETKANESENSSDEYVTSVTEPYPESPDSEYGAAVKSTTKSVLHSSDEAIKEAIKYIPDNDKSEIKEDKTQVTISRTSGGKSTYTVYFYTESKTFTVELNAVTLEMIEFKEKDKNTGNINNYSPAHFPETTAALPEYIPG